MSDGTDKRLTDLEISLAHVQRLYEQLNEVVTQQAMDSDRMRRKIEELSKQVREAKDKSPEEKTSLEDEKPPHY